jgi:hypothetical protein
MSSRWRITLRIVGAAAGTIILAMSIASIEISRHARDWVNDWLTHEYKSEVDLQSFKISVRFLLVQAEGDNLVLHFQGRKDLPPLIAVKHFTLRASFIGLLRNPRHIQFLHLEGLQINIPPRDENKMAGGTGIKEAMRKERSVHFGEILSENAILTILPNKPGKDPLEFDIERLNLHSSLKRGELIFRASLTNPKPPGQIYSNGSFGPWNSDAPSLSPVSGTYTLKNADLGVFRGISGTLSSKGFYKGVLEEIRVQGNTDTPDFQVTRAGHPLELSTTFDATVNGTNGDTFLHPVVAHFGKTNLVANGKVEGIAGRKGKKIVLDVTSDQAGIEDLLQFAVKESPPMSGPIQLKTKFVLTPGPEDISDRLYLDGSFNLDSVHFTSGTVQQRLDNISKRSLGKPKEVESPQNATSADDVASAMEGHFQLLLGTITLSRVAFQFPGTNVHINGTYDLDQENLNIHGIVELQAKLSQTTTGAKSFFLKIVDPFFSKDGKGAVLPVKITGPLNHPSYGLDFGRKREKEEARN